MKTVLAVLSLALLAACQTTPKLEDDARYTRLARVVDVHVFSDAERREAAKTEPRASRSSVGVGVGMGFGVGGGFGSIMVGGPVGGSRRDLPPLVSKGANRYTVQPLHSREKLEVNSYGKYQAGDCVKLFSGHPTEYDRLFDVRPGESCNGAKTPATAE